MPHGLALAVTPSYIVDSIGAYPGCRISLSSEGPAQTLALFLLLPLY